MPFCHQPVIAWPCTGEDCFIAAGDPGNWILAEAPAAYRPRHPERAGFYQLFETHFDSYVRAYEERFEARSGPLRPVIDNLLFPGRGMIAALGGNQRELFRRAGDIGAFTRAWGANRRKG